MIFIFSIPFLSQQNNMGWWLCSDSWLGRRLKFIKKIKVKCTSMLGNSVHVAALTCVQGTSSRDETVKEAIFVGAEVMMDDTPVFLKGSTLFLLPPLYFSSPATSPAMINHWPRTKRNLPLYLSAHSLSPLGLSKLLRSGIHPSMMSQRAKVPPWNLILGTPPLRWWEGASNL